MKSLSSLERTILECIGSSKMTYGEVQYQAGLHENVCFNLLQALLIRGFLKCEDGKYRINSEISNQIIEEVNGYDAKNSEYLELIESILNNKVERVFQMKKIALGPEDERIFNAMLSNLETFLNDSHRKSKSTTPMKNRKVIFWGMGEVQKMMGMIATGKQL